MNTEIAMHYLGMGVAPIPLRFRGKLPADGVKWKKLQKNLPPIAYVESVFSKASRFSNLGVILHPPYAVVDIDEPDAWLEIYDVLKNTHIVKSARGYHLWFRIVKTFYGVVSLSVDGENPVGELRGAGSMVVVPPSVHASGHKYEVINDAPIMTIEHWEELGLELLGIPRDAIFSGSYQGKDDSPVIRNIKSAFSITQVLARRGYLPSSNGGNIYRYVCPFHDDTNPSFIVDVATGSARCFAPHCPANAKSLDVINVYGLLYGRDNRSTINALAMELGI